MSSTLLRVDNPYNLSFSNNTVLRNFLDPFALATGWVPNINAASILQNSSSLGIVRYPTNKVIDNEWEVRLLLGVSYSYLTSPKPVIGAEIRHIPSGFQISYTKIAQGTADMVDGFILHKVNDNTLIFGFRGINPSFPLFLYLEKLTSDVAENITVLPVYLSQFSMMSTDAAFTVKNAQTSGRSVQLSRFLLVNPAYATYTSLELDSARRYLAYSYGPFYIVKPYGLGTVALPESIAVTIFRTQYSGLLTGAIQTNPPLLPASATTNTSITEHHTITVEQPMEAL